MDDGASVSSLESAGSWTDGQSSSAGSAYSPILLVHEEDGSDANAAMLLVRPSTLQREFFIDYLLVRAHLIIVMIRWTGLAPWEFDFPFQQYILHFADDPTSTQGPSRTCNESTEEEEAAAGWTAVLVSAL